MTLVYSWLIIWLKLQNQSFIKVNQTMYALVCRVAKRHINQFIWWMKCKYVQSTLDISDFLGGWKLSTRLEFVKECVMKSPKRFTLTDIPHKAWRYICRYFAKTDILYQNELCSVFFIFFMGNYGDYVLWPFDKKLIS